MVDEYIKLLKFSRYLSVLCTDVVIDRRVLLERWTHLDPKEGHLSQLFRNLSYRLVGESY